MKKKPGGFSTDEQKPQKSQYKIIIDSIDTSTTASSVRNLDAIFDSALSSEAFVDSTCKSARFNLFNINRSRTSPTTNAAKILMQAYVMSEIDYCYSLLYGIPDKLMNRIQRIQSYAARSSGCRNSTISHQHWPHYTSSLSIARSIARSHCWFTKL